MTEPTTMPPARRPADSRRWFVVAFAAVAVWLLGIGTFRLYVTYLGTPVRVTIDGLAVISDNDGTTYRAAYHFDLAGHTHVSKATVSDRLRRWLHDNAAAGRGVVPARAVRLPAGHAYCMLEDGPLTWLMLLVGAGAAAASAALARNRRHPAQLPV